MSQDSAFRPCGPTVCVATTVSSATLATQWTTGHMSQCYVSNPNAIPVYLNFGTSSIQGAIPTTAAPFNGLCLPSSGYKCFTVGPSTSQSAWVTGVTSAGQANIFVTPGYGF